jgi:MFS family permease
MEEFNSHRLRRSSCGYCSSGEEGAGHLLDEKPFSLWSRDFILICLANFCYFGSFYLLLPTLPQYVSFLGGTSGQVGMVMGFFTLASVLVRPYFGRLADRRGRKLPLMLGCGFHALFPILYIAITAVTPFYLVRVGHGIAHASFLVASMAYIADLAPPARRGEVLGIFGTSNVIAMAVFPAWGAKVIVSGSGFPYLFVLSSLTAVMAFLAIMVTADIRSADHREGKPHGFLKAGGRREVFLPSLALFSGAVCYGAVLTFLPLFAPERSIPDFGIFFTAYAASTVLSRIGTGRLSDRVGRRRVILPCMVLLALTMGLLSFLCSLWFLALIGVLFGLSFGSLMPNLNALVVDLTPPQQRGSALAFFISSIDVGITVGSMALGFVGESLGYPAVYGFCGAIVLSSLVIFSVLLRSPEKAGTPRMNP